MIAIPLSHKMSWRNPPMITLLLIFINCLIFFLFQYNDDQKHMQAERFYFSSPLGRLEAGFYLAYRQHHSANQAEPPVAGESGAEIDEEALPRR